MTEKVEPTGNDEFVFQIDSKREMLKRLEELIALPEVYFRYKVPSEEVDEPGEYLIGYFFPGISQEQKTEGQIEYTGLYEFGSIFKFRDSYSDLIPTFRHYIESGRVTEISLRRTLPEEQTTFKHFPGTRRIKIMEEPNV